MGSLIDININTDGLAKLAETVAHATGLKAFGMKKETDAQVYDILEKAKLDSQLQILKMGSEENIRRYIYVQEQRKIQNVEKVIKGALNEFSADEKVSDKEVNPDWSTRFFNMAEDISDEDMQKLWSKILANEVKNPGSFSLRTLNILCNLTKEEADIFIDFSKIVIEKEFGSLIITEHDVIPDINHILLLEEAGLMNSTEIQYNLEAGDIPNLLAFRINGYTIFAEYEERSEKKKMPLKIKKFSTNANELFKLVERTEMDISYLRKLGMLFKKRGSIRCFCLKNIDDLNFEPNPIFFM